MLKSFYLPCSSWITILSDFQKTKSEIDVIIHMQAEMRSNIEGSLNPELFQKYAIVDGDAEFENALQNGGKIPTGGIISVKSSRNKKEEHAKQRESDKSGKSRGKNEHGSSSKSNKKRKSSH